MNIKVIAAALALAIAAPAAQAGCEGIEDKKELKACEKKAKARAKADARSTPYVPSELDASFSGWDGENNPFATDDYRVRVSPTEIASVDEYLGKAFRIQATVVFTKFIVSEIGAGNADAIKAAPKLVPLMAKVAEDGQALIAEGQGLVTSLPSQLAGPDALKIPKLIPAIKDGIGAVTGAVGEAPDTVKALGAVASNPGAAAGAAAGVGAEAAGGAAGDAVEAATE